MRHRAGAILMGMLVGTWALTGGALLTGLLTGWPGSPWLMVNTSDSLPHGVYWVHTAGEVTYGTTVLFAPSPMTEALMLERGYLWMRMPLLKTVVGLPGDEVCIGPDVQVNQRRLGATAEQDGAGRPLSPWYGCHRLEDGDLFLLNDVTHSYDSRYFGPVRREQVLGSATLVLEFQ